MLSAQHFLLVGKHMQFVSIPVAANSLQIAGG